MPKFKYDCTVNMNDTLKTLGIPNAFESDKADFSRMAESSLYARFYIIKVLHKTFISVDELGTKAGAVTMVAMSDGSSRARQ